LAEEILSTRHIPLLDLAIIWPESCMMITAKGKICLIINFIIVVKMLFRRSRVIHHLAKKKLVLMVARVCSTLFIKLAGTSTSFGVSIAPCVL
jgi:hypothetical protein